MAKSKARKTKTKTKPKPKRKYRAKSTDVDALVKAGEVVVEEIDLLRLQKLAFEKAALEGKMEVMKCDFDDAGRRVQSVSREYDQTLADILRRMGLSDKHSFSLSGDRAGVVFEIK